MIRSRAAVGNFICLRCQVRRLPYNAQTSAPVNGGRVLPWTIVNPGQLRYSSTDTNLDKAIYEQIAGTSEGIVDTSREPVNPPPSHDFPEATPKGRERIKNLRPGEKMVYMRKGNRVVPLSEDLSVGILGRPGQALIMKELGDGSWARVGGKDSEANAPKPSIKKKVKRKTKGKGKTKAKAGEVLVKTVSDEENYLSAMGVKLWEGLDQNRTQAPTQDEIHAYITGLQPTGNTIIPQQQFDELIETLVTGFTNKQLADYISENPGILTLKDLPSGKKASWVEARKPWMSQNTLSRQRAVQSLQPGTRPMPVKEALVLRLMQDCWGLSVRELVTGMGHLDVHIRDPEFSLLLVGAKRFVSMLSRVHLRKIGGRIELRRNDRLMRIFAPKAVAEAVLFELDEVLITTRTERISLESITLDPPSHEVIGRLAELTNTVIKFSKGKRELVVSWIHRDRARAPEEHAGWETMMEKIYRLLLTACGPGNKPPSVTVLPTLDPDQETGSLIVDHGARATSPPWNLQIAGSWSRLQRPQVHTDLKNTAQASSTLEAPLSLLKWPVDFNFREHFHFFVDRNTSFGGDVPVYGRWSKVRTSTQATFGHIMHHHQESPAAARLPVTPEWKLPRMFFPVTPPLLHNDFQDPQPAGPYRTEVVVRLVPSPLHPSTKAHKPPTLELRFLTRLNVPRGIQSATLVAIHDTHEADLLLPSGPVDARITQRQVSLLRGPDLHGAPNMKPIREFAQGSTLDLIGNNFGTPAAVKDLSLPIYLMGDGSLQPTGDSSEDAFVTLDYLFAGIELHRRVDGAAYGENLVYTSIRDPMQPGRNRAEVSLHPELPPQPKPRSGEEGCGTAQHDMDDVARAMAELMSETTEEPPRTSERFLQGVTTLASNQTMKWALV